MDELDLARYGLVDPTDPSLRSAAAASTDRETPATGPLANLRSAEIEFLWNGKSNGDILMRTFEGWLTDSQHIHSLGVTAKLRPNTTAPAELLSDIAARASLVFTGPGD
jgi:hypothetical protein